MKRDLLINFSYHTAQKVTILVVASLYLLFGSIVAIGYHNRALASGGYTARDVIGQNTNGAVDYTTSKYNDLTVANNTGFLRPDAMAIDSVNHRLFIADQEYPRILVFNLDSGDSAVDRAADYVIGESDFVGIGQGTSRSQMNYITGMAIDSINHWLYVADANNNRVLQFNINSLSNGQDASAVLGQSDFTSSGGGFSPTKLNQPNGLALDTVHHQLFISDQGNSRVIIHTLDTTNNIVDQSADYALGATDTNTQGAGSGPNNASDSTISPYSLAVDSSAQKLYVGDLGIGRVMIFNTSSLSNNEPASNVLGKPDFTTLIDTTVSQTNTPSVNGLAIDPVQNKLFVADAGNNRVLVFSTSGLTDGEPASNVFGQANFTSNSSGLSRTALTFPVGLNEDAAHHRLYIADRDNHRVIVQDTSSITDNQNATNVIGQTDGTLTPRYTTNIPWNLYANEHGFTQPIGDAVDTIHHRLFVSDNQNNRVLVFNLTNENNLPDRYADYVIGQTDFFSSSYGSTATTLKGPGGLIYDSVNQRLFVADLINNRVLEYNVSTISNGMAAEHVLGQPDFTTVSSGTSSTKLYGPATMAYDAIHEHLFVSETYNQRVVEFDVNSISDGEPAVHELGQTDFDTTGVYAVNAHQIAPIGMAYDTNHDRLFVSDFGANRTLVFTGANNLTNDQDASIVLGQDNFSGSGYGGATASNIGFSYGMAYDTKLDQLILSDTNTNRILIFDGAAIANHSSALAVIGQADFTSNSSGTSQSKFHTPASIALNTGERKFFVVDASNNRVLQFNTVRSTASSMPNGTTGTSYNQVLTYSQAQGTVTASVTSGNLPPGLSISGTSIVGTPTTAGTYSFIVQLLDDNGDIGHFIEKASFSITVSASATTVESPPPDTEPPTVNIVYPSASPATVSGNQVVLVAGGTDNVGITRIDFYRDNVFMATGIYTIYGDFLFWDSTSVDDGTYNITAKAYDAAGNSAVSQPLVLHVLNHPSSGTPPSGGTSTPIPPSIGSIENLLNPRLPNPPSAPGPTGVIGILTSATRSTGKFIWQLPTASVSLLKHVPRAVAVGFPYILFALLMALAVALLLQTQVEVSKTRRLASLYNVHERIGEERNNFISLVSHYLGTPISIMQVTIDLLGSTGKLSKDLADRAQQVVKRMGQRIRAITSEINSLGDREIKRTERLKLQAPKPKPYLSVYVMIPVVLVAVVAFMANWLFSLSGKISPSLIGILVQTFVYLITVQVLFMAFRYRSLSRHNFVVAQVVALQESDLDASRLGFMQSSLDMMDQDIGEIRAITQTLPATDVGGIDQSATKLRSLIGRLKLINRIESSQFKLDLQTVDVTGMIVDIVNRHEKDITKKQIDFKFENHPQREIHHSIEVMNLVLDTVIDNAIKFSRAQGKIDVKIRRLNDRSGLVVTVEDQGIGISPDKLRQLFKPFSRAESVLTFNYEGLGLSLYVDKIVLERLGGNIAMDSKPQKGTKVSIILKNLTNDNDPALQHDSKLDHPDISQAPQAPTPQQQSGASTEVPPAIAPSEKNPTKIEVQMGDFSK